MISERRHQRRLNNALRESLFLNFWNFKYSIKQKLKIN